MSRVNICLFISVVAMVILIACQTAEAVPVKDAAVSGTTAQINAEKPVVAGHVLEAAHHSREKRKGGGGKGGGGKGSGLAGAALGGAAGGVASGLLNNVLGGK